MWQCFLKVEVLNESGEGSGSVLDVVDSTFTLGSDSSLCNIILPHEDVEPVHAHIDVDPDNPAWHVFVRSSFPHEECSRKVGRQRMPAMTVLNGFPLWRTQPLHRGDVLSIGPFDLSIVDAGVVLHTGERLVLCSDCVGGISAPEVNEKIKAECEWFTDTILHRPPFPTPTIKDGAKETTDSADTATEIESETAMIDEPEHQEPDMQDGDGDDHGEMKPELNEDDNEVKPQVNEEDMVTEPVTETVKESPDENAMIADSQQTS